MLHMGSLFPVTGHKVKVNYDVPLQITGQLASRVFGPSGSQARGQKTSPWETKNIKELEQTCCFFHMDLFFFFFFGWCFLDFWFARCFALAICRSDVSTTFSGLPSAMLPAKLRNLVWKMWVAVLSYHLWNSYIMFCFAVRKKVRNFVCFPPTGTYLAWHSLI